VVWHGAKLDTGNPAASVFRLAAGDIGYRFFGFVMWCAAITSVVGASYTTVSFFKTLHPFLEKQSRVLVSLFILGSTLIFVGLGNPVKLLVAAGAVNGVILPVALAFILIAANKKSLVGDYRHPVWMQVAGWLVVAAVGYMSGLSIVKILLQ
jgi:Mn2+/Fe2+ NRAMP family transporter